MHTISTIRILEREPNRQGDLFARLMGDLFLALGYDKVRVNIQKTGHEVDIEALHRTERKRVIAECKATKAKIGSDKINKFVGVLDSEKRKYPKIQTTGYYISLSGFTETAIEQEKDAGGGRVVLLDGNMVIRELINGRIIVSPAKAMERAGHCAANQSVDLLPETVCELLAHNIGWIWVVYYTKNKQRTHFALIHADGESIAPSLANTIIQSDMLVGGTLHSLTYLPPPVELSISEKQISKTRLQYFQYLASEYGQITLEGLPPDQEVSSHRLKLENIFVPLSLEPLKEYELGISFSFEEEVQKDTPEQRKLVGSILSEYSRLVILAPPGAGKTTLLKRIAIAYAFPDRRALIEDHLPDRPWLPLFINCRHLGELRNSPIVDILYAIPQRAEMSNLTKIFVQLVNDALKSGNALLLVDGIDEISNESARVVFVKQLSTFLATYPSINIIITSREVGFRIIGRALSSYCQHYKIANFDYKDIKRLTLAWHKEVIGDRPEFRAKAEQLVESICNSNSLWQLAQNPLLLTTLLLVNRWVSQLPTRRSVLYGKAIEVLLATWNVEGHEPIDQEEAIPQLAYIAFTMMKDGVKRVSLRRLKEILILARKQMPEILSYSRFSVTEFIQRVELRSSLMILSGYEIEQGTLYPMYEFRHLIFQEYLAARAVVDGYYPDRKDEDTILRILEPHLGDQNWKEVITLAAVMAGRKVQPLIHHLIDLCKKIPTSHYSREEFFPVTLLGQCILDEIQIPPVLMKEGLEWISRRARGFFNLIQPIFRGKYGKLLLKVVQDAYISSNKDLLYIGNAIGEITLAQINWTKSQDLTPKIVDKITTLLINKNSISKAAAALAVMNIGYNYFRSKKFHKKSKLSVDEKKFLKALGDHLIPLLYSDDHYLYFAACWALAYLGAVRAWSPEHKPIVIARLLEIWRKSELPDVQFVAALAISSLPVIDRKLKPLPEPDPDMITFIRKQSSLKTDTRSNREKVLASFVIGFYWKKPWTDAELTHFVVAMYDRISDYDRFKCESLLKALG